MIKQPILHVPRPEYSARQGKTWVVDFVDIIINWTIFNLNITKHRFEISKCYEITVGPFYYQGWTLIPA